MDLIEQAKKRLDEARSAHTAVADDYEARLATLPEDASVDDIQAVTDEFGTKLDEAETVAKRAKAQLDQVESIAEARKVSAALIPAGTAEVTPGVAASESRVGIEVKEPLEYDPSNPYKSYFGDLYRFNKHQDRGALERLQRNSLQTEEALKEAGKTLYDAEGRAMSSTSTAGGDFLPPLYFGELYAGFKQARRVTANLVRNLPLAAHGNTITIPRMTSGSTVAAQTADNASTNNVDAVTAIVTIPVCTVTGYIDLSRQIVERSEPGLDQLILEDLLNNYNKKVNSYVVNGTGSNGQPTGILTQSGTNAITYTDGSPTVPELYPKVMDSVRQVTENVFEPTVGLVMTARRWAWILSAVDSSNRPLAVANGQGPYNALGLHSDANSSFVDNMVPAGWFGGYAVYIDETLPKTNGSGTNEDVIIAGAFKEDILWEDSAGPRQFTFEGVTSATAAIRVQVFGYMAFTAGRYPAANSKITGTGLAAPTF